MNAETPVTPPAPQPQDPRRRLRELLAVPERDRTDEQWDEIVELEIQLAPGNRIGANDAPMGRQHHHNPNHGHGGAHSQQPRKFRPNKNGGGGGGGNGNNNNHHRRPKPNKPRDPVA